MPQAAVNGGPRPSSAVVWLTLLSLDAPIVAALWQRLFARNLSVRLDWAVTATLAIAVWLLYVLDRLLDSLRTPTNPEPLRHRFYRSHGRFFLPPFFVALAAGAWLAFTRLDSNTVETGLVLMMAVGVYFFSAHFRPVVGESRVPKEMIVAVLFAAGSTFPVWQATPAAHARMLPPLLIFTLLCWTNCAAIEYSDGKSQPANDTDEKSAEGESGVASQQEGAERLGLHPSTSWLGANLAGAALAIGFATLTLLFFHSARLIWPVYAAEATSAAAIVVVAGQAKRMNRDLFRVLMDVALFAPGLFMF